MNYKYSAGTRGILRGIKNALSILFEVLGEKKTGRIAWYTYTTLRPLQSVASTRAAASETPLLSPHEDDELNKRAFHNRESTTREDTSDKENVSASVETLSVTTSMKRLSMGRIQWLISSAYNLTRSQRSDSVFSDILC